MIANLIRTLPLILLTAGFLTLSRGQAAGAQADQDAIAVVRSVIKADRQAVVAKRCNSPRRKPRPSGRFTTSIGPRWTGGRRTSESGAGIRQILPGRSEDRAQKMLRSQATWKETSLHAGLLPQEIWQVLRPPKI
jgi:hypothetical protein